MTLSSTMSGEADMPHSRLDAPLSSRMLRRQTTVPLPRRGSGTHQGRQAHTGGRHDTSALPAARRRPSSRRTHRPRSSSRARDRSGRRAGDDFLTTPLLDREGTAAGNDERGVAETDRLLPQLSQSRGRPLGQDAFRASAVTRGPAEVRTAIAVRAAGADSRIDSPDASAASGGDPAAADAADGTGPSPARWRARSASSAS